MAKRRDAGRTVTPVRRQYLKIKHSYPDAIVLFRLGDFYEAFDDDARLAARELEITLTSRSMGKDLKVPMQSPHLSHCACVLALATLAYERHCRSGRSDCDSHPDNDMHT